MVGHEAIARQTPLDLPRIFDRAAKSRDWPPIRMPRRIGSRTNRWSRLSAGRIAILAKRGSSAPASAQRFELGMALDFVFDRCANGQQHKCLTVTDEFTKKGWRSTSRAASALCRASKRAQRANLLPATTASGFVQAALVLDCRAEDGTVLIERGKRVRMASRRCRTRCPLKCSPTILDMRLRRSCRYR